MATPAPLIARFYARALTILAQPIPPDVAAMAAAPLDSEGGTNYSVQLEALLDTATAPQLAAIVYDGRNRLARRMADWWDDLQTDKSARTAEEQRLVAKAALQASGLAKLTAAERDALGL